MKVQELDKVIGLLQKLVDYAFNNPPEKADDFDPYAIDVYESENPRFASLAKIIVKLADKIYIRAGGENIDDTRNDLTPFGSAFLNVIDGVICALIIGDAYEFSWCYDPDSFFDERLEFLEQCTDPTGFGNYTTEDDPVMAELYRAVSSLRSPKEEPEQQIEVAGEDLMERWARLAGVRR